MHASAVMGAPAFSRAAGCPTTTIVPEWTLGRVTSWRYAGGGGCGPARRLSSDRRYRRRRAWCWCGPHGSADWDLEGSGPRFLVLVVRTRPGARELWYGRVKAGAGRGGVL